MFYKCKNCEYEEIRCHLLPHIEGLVLLTLMGVTVLALDFSLRWLRSSGNPFLMSLGTLQFLPPPIVKVIYWGLLFLYGAFFILVLLNDIEFAIRMKKKCPNCGGRKWTRRRGGFGSD